MKIIINTSKKILAIGILSSIIFSCSEDLMDRINQNNNNPKSVDSKFILTDVLTSTAFYNTGGDFNTYFASYVEHEVGVYNQLYQAETRDNATFLPSTFNNVWNNCYSTLKNALIIIEQCSEGGRQAGNDVTKGIGQVMAAYNLALITDVFGDTPWTEACKLTDYKNPKLDTQETIYTDIMEYLDEAIVNLQSTDAHASGSVGAYDLLYNGNKNKWLKFAYGLKARYTMRLIHRSTNVTTDMNNVLTYIANSFASAEDQAAFAIYDATNLNPLFDFQWSRDYLAASQSMANKLIERNDPRLRRVFVDAGWVQLESVDDLYLAPNGNPSQVQYTYNTSIFVYSQTAPTLLLSYHELLFLKAEALCRLGQSAESTLKEAIVAAIANTELSVQAAFNAPSVNVYGGLEETTAAITTAEAESYFDTIVQPLYVVNPLKEIMIQKYIAFFGASGESTECYNDIRRMKALGEDFVMLENPNRFPLRCPYGSSDTTANPNVLEAFGDGSYVYSIPVWWAGGSR